MKRALVSVSNKTGLVDFVKGLIDEGYEIISTGGTKKALEDAGLSVIGISEITNFPEIMDGRVKTLHPNVHGALLCVRDNPDHVAQVEELGIDMIDLVCVNLYPFKETVQKEGVSHEEIIENIDIGGPSMLRSASKNYKFIPVLCDPADYDLVLNEIKELGGTTLETREKLAAKVFRHTARYDAMIADYLTKKTDEQFPESLTITFDKVQDLRYGENPHQKAAFYKGMRPLYSLANAKQLHGKELSYNNIQDGNAAIEILKDFEGQFAAVGLKHMNPCGVGIGASINEAWDKAYEADPVSIFWRHRGVERAGGRGTGGEIVENLFGDRHRSEIRRGRAGNPDAEKEHPAHGAGYDAEHEHGVEIHERQRRLACAGNGHASCQRGRLALRDEPQADGRGNETAAVWMERREAREIERDRFSQRQHDDWRGRRTNEPGRRGENRDRASWRKSARLGHGQRRLLPDAGYGAGSHQGWRDGDHSARWIH